MTQDSRKKVESGHSQQYSSRKQCDIQEIVETHFIYLFIYFIYIENTQQFQLFLIFEKSESLFNGIVLIDILVRQLNCNVFKLLDSSLKDSLKTAN